MLYKIFGVNEEYFRKTSPEDAGRQKSIYGWLGAMVYALTALSAVGIGVYGLAIFQSWIVAVFAGAGLALVIHNLLRLMLVLSIAPKQAELYDVWVDQHRLYEPHYGEDFRGLTEEKTLEVVYAHKQSLRDRQGSILRETRGWGYWPLHVLKLATLAVFALIVANGLELLLFSDSINQVLDALKANLKPEDYAYQNLLSQDNDVPFLFLRSRSILLDLHILSFGLGYWKWVLDLLVIAAFWAPLVLVQKSREFTEGTYARELALSEITIGYYHFLRTQHHCQVILDDLARFDHHKALTGRPAQ